MNRQALAVLIPIIFIAIMCFLVDPAKPEAPKKPVDIVKKS